MIDPEISVVMPAYKGASFIGAALESVLAQTFADWELVCVDDGSRDGSGDIAAEYAARDGRIRVLRQANGGTSAARNAGIERAPSVGGVWKFSADGSVFVARGFMSV